MKTKTVIDEKQQIKRPKIGLALGAGSARGLAHIGVLQVFEENGIPIDCIAGSSMGSVIGGIYACGTDLSILCKLIPQLKEKDYFDVSLLKNGGFLRGDRFKEIIRLLTKNRSFDQTDIPFACVATDAKNCELVELREGNLSEAIRASIAIPGLIAPHMLGGRLLVDGGVLSRVPAQTAREMGADVVIGVDVGYRGDPTERATRPLSMLYAAIDIMSWEIARHCESCADLVIVPKVRHINPNSFEQALECIELGRQAAREALDDINRLITVADEEDQASEPVLIA